MVPLGQPFQQDGKAGRGACIPCRVSLCVLVVISRARFVDIPLRMYILHGTNRRSKTSSPRLSTLWIYILSVLMAGENLEVVFLFLCFAKRSSYCTSRNRLFYTTQ